MQACVRAHLQPGLLGAGALGKDVDDEPHAIHHRPAPSPLQVPLLHPAQHLIHKDPACHAGPSPGVPIDTAIVIACTSLSRDVYRKNGPQLRRHASPHKRGALQLPASARGGSEKH